MGFTGCRLVLGLPCRQSCLLIGLGAMLLSPLGGSPASALPPALQLWSLTSHIAGEESFQAPVTAAQRSLLRELMC